VARARALPSSPPNAFATLPLTAVCFSRVMPTSWSCPSPPPFPPPFISACGRDFFFDGPQRHGSSPKYCQTRA
jgi:hypothetical protein